MWRSVVTYLTNLCHAGAEPSRAGTCWTHLGTFCLCAPCPDPQSPGQGRAMWSCENIEKSQWSLIGKLVHDWFTPLPPPPLVKVTLRGVWVVRPVGADQIGHGAEGALLPATAARWPPGLCGKTRGPGKCQKRPPMGSMGEEGGTITRHPASNLERDDLG